MAGGGALVSGAPPALRSFLLRCYHQALEGHGIRGYDLDALWHDYRLAVVEQLALPVFQVKIKLGPWIWWGHFERIMLAFEDLGCEELLDGV
jgi:hypothetical protein